VRYETTRSVWSTSDVAAADSFGYWSDVICDAFVRVAARATGDTPFAGRIEHTDLAGLGLSTLSSGPQEVVRTRRQIARDPDAYLLANIQVAGEALVQQGGRAASLMPGAMAFVDSTRPYTLSFTGPFSQLVVRVPRSLLPDRPFTRATAVGLDVSGPGRLVADFLLGLDRQHRIDPAAAAALLPHALGLVETALDWAGGTGHPESSDALTRERIIRFVSRHAHDPDLDANAVAVACGFSRRTLYRALAGGGDSLTALIRRERVARARRMLRSRPDRPLSAVAQECGFGGPAQLHRAFRTVTGTTPGAYREGAAETGEPEP
jgi:AraC-like DNA-binding protein